MWDMRSDLDLKTVIIPMILLIVCVTGMSALSFTIGHR
jgi:hypothetical protein